MPGPPTPMPLPQSFLAMLIPVIDPQRNGTAMHLQVISYFSRGLPSKLIKIPWMRSTTRGSLSFCAWRRTSSSLEMVALFPFANVGRILPIIAHFSEYVELFMRTYIGVPMGRPLDKKEAVLYGQFVHAAYNMFKRDPTQLRPQPATGDIPDPYEL